MSSVHPLGQRQTDQPGHVPGSGSAGVSDYAAHGTVVVYPGNAERSPCSHESATCRELARRLAEIKGYDFAGEFDAARSYSGALYFVPSDTFVTVEAAHQLGIHGEHDLFGGVVPFPFIATKTITHPLPAKDAHAPQGWSFDLAQRVRDVVLPGFSAFSLRDARDAAARLLDQGAVRIKKPSGIGGLGQWVASDAGEFESHLLALNEQDVEREGLVIERNLTKVTTMSVGQVRVGNLLATYYGTQQLTTNNAGENVYGGSTLTVVHGDFDALLRLVLAREALTAIEQARIYHAGVMQSYPAMFASRCNYDVAQGFDEQGRWQSGVLEQSWRIGGASGAEVEALCAFRADPSLRAVRASTCELYGTDTAVPADAMVYFRGVDESVGPITKYSRLEPYANP